jgi:hypothetical protein
MGRHSTVASHSEIARINRMLDDHVPYMTIARDFNLSLGSVGRYALSRKSEFAKIADGEPNFTDLASRLLQVADHARDTRQQTRIGGSPVAQSRAIKSEAEVLTKLLSELGVTDSTVTELFEQVQVIVDVLTRFARTEPAHARPLIDLLRPTVLADLADVLTRHLGDTK